MPTQSPVVSIIIPLFNREVLVNETLTSLQAQTYPYWEALVIDDGSTDQSYEVVEAIAQQEERIKLLRRHREPKGAPTCRNIGIDKASGKYIIFLDSDDLMAPFCLKQRVAAMEKQSHLDFVVFNMLLFKEEINDTNLLWNTDSEESDLVRFLRADGVWSSTGPIHRKSAITQSAYWQKSHCFWEEDLPFWQDLELHIRVISQGWRYVKHLDASPDCYIRRHGGLSISQQGFETIEKQHAKIDIYQQLVKQIEGQKELQPAERTAVVSFLFNSARHLVLDYQDIAKAIEVWIYVRQKGQLSPVAFELGKHHLTYLYQSQKYQSVLYVHLAKIMAVLLPRRYKHLPTTIGQVPFAHE